jgi:hypothetical protein
MNLPGSRSLPERPVTLVAKDRNGREITIIRLQNELQDRCFLSDRGNPG